MTKADDSASNALRQDSELGITPEMVEAGRRVLVESGVIGFGGELGCEGGIATDIYLAMQMAGGGGK